MGEASVEARRRVLMGTGNVMEFLGLALMIGGMLALGAFVAPAVFGNFPREAAGLVMTRIFRRYDAVLLVSLILVFAGETIRTVFLGSFGRWLDRVRYAVMIVLAVLTLFTVLIVHPQIESFQQAGVRRGVGEQGMAFDRLHRQSETLYKGGLALAVILLVLASIPAPRPGTQS